MTSGQDHTDPMSQKSINKSCKPDLVLTDLPPEILEVILLQALPDPTDLRWAFGPHVAIHLLTAPILRTSRFLRHKCLALIRNTYLWIHVALHDRDVIEEFQDHNPYIPALPARLYPLVLQDSASVRLDFTPTSMPREEAGPDDAIVLPFNFATLIHVCNAVNQLPSEIFGASLTIECHNIDGHFRGMVQSLVAPALKTLYRLSMIRVQGSSGRELFEPIITDMLVHIQSWNLDSVAKRASFVLQQAGELRQGGFYEESDMFFLHHASFKYLAAELLPPPGAWISGDYDPATADDGVSSPFTGQCAKGNQLRRLIRQIDHHACLAYIHFVTQYGWKWVEAYRLSFGVGHESFLAEPSYTWFGASTTELGDLHYERALIKELAWKYRNMRDHRQSEKLYSEDAMLEMYFAQLLQPTNTKYGQLYEAYYEQLGKRGRVVELQGERRFTVIMSETPLPHNLGPMSWVGDRQMLDAWGGENILEYVPLVQKGLEISPTLTEWAISAIGIPAFHPLHDRNIKTPCTNTLVA